MSKNLEVIKNDISKLILDLQRGAISDEAANSRIIILQEDYLKELDRIDNETKDAKLTDDAKKARAEAVEAMTSGIPATTKSIIALIKVNKTDPYATSAAVMDVMGAAAPMVLAGLTLVAGAALGPFAAPLGALVGALFSMVGQILGEFVQKQPSLKDKIERMMDHLQSEEKKDAMKAVGHSINTHVNMLRTVSIGDPKSGMKGLVDILEMPLNSTREAQEFKKHLGAVTIELNLNSIKTGPSEFKAWEVAAYLQNKEKRDKEGWAEVFGTWCRVYSDLMAADQILQYIADENTIQARVDETSNSNNLKVGECNNALIELQSLMIALRAQSGPRNKTALSILQSLESTAKSRGLFIHVNDGRNVYIGVGKSNGDINYEKRLGGVSQFSMAITNGQLSEEQPIYDMVVLDKMEKNSDSERVLNLHSFSSTDGKEASNGRVLKLRPVHNPKSQHPPLGKAMDISLLPSANDKDGTLLFSLHRRDANWSYVLEHEVDSDGGFDTSNWAPGTPERLARIAVLAHSGDTVPDDPDGDSRDKPGSPILRKGQHLAYGILENDPKIILLTNINKYHSLKAPDNWSNHKDVEVTEDYVWIFGDKGIACATHASVMQAVNKTRAAPRWCVYNLDKELLFKKANVGKIWVDTVSPCQDGTLIMGIGTQNQHSSVFVAEFAVDLEVPKLEISKWSKSVGGGNDCVKQIKKMPIPCWDLYTKLKKNVEG